MSKQANRFYEFGPFRIGEGKRVLLRKGEDVPLVLVWHRSEMLVKDRLLEMIRPDSNVEEANLPQNISALREALGERASERRYTLTVPGRGYRFAVSTETGPDCAFSCEVARGGAFRVVHRVYQESGPII